MSGLRPNLLFSCVHCLFDETLKLRSFGFWFLCKAIQTLTSAVSELRRGERADSGGAGSARRVRGAARRASLAADERRSGRRGGRQRCAATDEWGGGCERRVIAVPYCIRRT